MSNHLSTEEIEEIQQNIRAAFQATRHCGQWYSTAEIATLAGVIRNSYAYGNIIRNMSTARLPLDKAFFIQRKNQSPDIPDPRTGEISEYEWSPIRRRIS